MLETIDRLFGEVESGGMSRRAAVLRLTALVAAIAGAPRLANAEQGGGTFDAIGLNHIALEVTDIGRSRDFYNKHLGMQVLNESRHNCFMSCGKDHFVALFRSDSPGLDHYCYTIDDYDAAEVVERLKAAGLDPRRRENRVYFDDPDGLTVQLAGRRSSWPG